MKKLSNAKRTLYNCLSILLCLQYWYDLEEMKIYKGENSVSIVTPLQRVGVTTFIKQIIKEKRK